MIDQSPDLLSEISSSLLSHGGSIGVMGTVLVCTRWIMHQLKPLLAWAKVHIDEHDLMWEDYCKRNGISWRRPLGRGTNDAPLNQSGNQN